MPTIAGIASYIETKVGGVVFPFDDKKLKAVNFRWKKMNPNTKEGLRYNYKVSYLDLETMIEPMAIAMGIVDKIERGAE